MKKILVSIFIVFALVACAGPQPVKPYELGKVTAETILYEARMAQNRAQITAAQFDEVRKVYDQLKQAQDIAIDARKAMITFNTVDNQKKATVAMDSVFRISAQMITLANSVGLMKGGI
jgi:hypothetical protein